jgi:iron complex outermembrane recepter protein
MQHSIRRKRIRRLVLATTMMAALAPATAWAQQQDDESEIVVNGQLLSTQAAIAAKRNATSVVEVISADDLGKIPDATVADALARVPGLSVIVNQETGEGQYVTIRGLSGTYNATMVNGVRVAQTDTGSRDVSLNLLPPNGLAEIRVTKTLTPDQDGDAIGGTINFRTPTAFDFKNGQILRAWLSGGFNSYARNSGEDAALYQGQLDFGRRFADDRFGIFVSGNYGVTHGNSQETENDGEWEPYVWRKNSTETISQTNMHLPGIDLDYRRFKQTRWGGNASFDYHGDSTQLYLRGQYAHLEKVGTNDYTDYRSRKSARLTQVNPEDTSLRQPEDMITGNDAKLGNVYGYTTKQIVDVDGDGRITDADRKSKQYWSLNGRSGVWDPKTFQFARSFETQDYTQYLATVQVGGTTGIDKLKLTYDLSYSGGTQETPGQYSVSYNCDACTYPLNATGIDWVSHDPRFPHASLPAYAANVERDPTLLPMDGAGLSRWKQSDHRWAAKLDARYDLGGLIDHVQVGGKWLRSSRSYDSTPVWNGDFSGTSLDGKSLGASGLIQKNVNSILGGEYYYGAVLSRQAVIAAINAAIAAQPGSLTSGTDLLRDDRSGRETIAAGYALADIKAGAVDIVAGGRVEHRDTYNHFWSDDGDKSGFDSTSRGYTVFLPSVTANWRPDDRHVYRAALWTGYSPPEYGYLSSGQSVGRDKATNEIISISRGNPDLKPARSTNADVSLEWYPDASSQLSLAGYYKHIRNFIFTNGSQVDAATKSGTIEITQPQNGKTAEVYGFELGVIKQLQGLAAPFDGFGLEGNLTVQHSAADSGQAYRGGKKMRFVNTPHLLYNAAITYQKYGIEMKLSYNYRGKYIEDLRDNAVDKWVQHNRSVDFHSRYNITGNIAVDFDVANLLNDWRYYTTKGDNPSYQKDYMEPGRTFILRTNINF